ncbi:granzyme A-like [Gymnogyps californianus]|uniref:granzyme A-like n=1 Tax=Gymnogyps californianus TaxID=33616 RepID=UPI0021CA96AD|nr:granzyme A-like [Gymnogyps californianus]
MTSHLLALLLSLIAVIPPQRYGCTDIIGGRVVRPHSWPYMAAIQRKNLTECGGALVEKQWVLTAAHCQSNKSEVRVVLGAHQASIAEKEQQIFKVMHYFPNPQFDRSSKENDIMLLKLNGIAKLNKFVQLLPLPDSCEDIEPGTMCKVAGWGVTSSGKPSKYLRKTTLKIVGRKSCQSKYVNYTKITSNMLCAIGKNKFLKTDACQGDSGGPLICAGRYSGIVSFGKGCGRRDMPGVYTRLTEKYIDWIKKIISLHRDP